MWNRGPWGLGITATLPRGGYWGGGSRGGSGMPGLSAKFTSGLSTHCTLPYFKVLYRRASDTTGHRGVR